MEPVGTCPTEARNIKNIPISLSNFFLVENTREGLQWSVSIISDFFYNNFALINMQGHIARISNIDEIVIITQKEQLTKNKGKAGT